MRKHNAASDNAVTLIHNRPTADQYLHLRAQTGWHKVSAQEVEKAMAASLCSLLAVHQNRVVGCARIIGDGGLYFYIQDMIVDRDYRGQDIGSRMMRELFRWLTKHAGGNAFIGLMAADGAETFYQKFGFRARADGQPGMSISLQAIQAGKEISPSK